MNEETNKLNRRLLNLERQVKLLERTIHSISDTTYKTSKREIINREVQFLQKVYDKNGGIVGEINP